MKHDTLNPFYKLFLRLFDRRGFKYDGILNLYKINLDEANSLLCSKSADFWETHGQEMALSLFHEAAESVPAYKDFLRKNNIKHTEIKTIDDFKNVPFTDKENYIKAYSSEELSWDGKVEENTIFSVSSGSSGTPYFWPRGDNLEIETSLIHALILKEFFDAGSTPTLVVISFSMGIYIAGIITLDSILHTSQMGLPISIIAPGVELNDVLRAIKELGPKYNQIVLAGYPPFVKDIIDAGEKRGISWENQKIKFLFATENFSEAFRDYILSKTNATSAESTSINIYGSADSGILGHETPLSVAIRRAASEDKDTASELWGDETFTPTFVQYHPIFKFFEEQEGELLFTARGGVPLVRYNVHDAGKIIPFDEVMKISSLASDQSVQKQPKWTFPFLAVFGKSDFTISFYGLKIYPENIKEGLENEEVVPFATGKFVMQQKSKSNQDQYWEITVELREGVKESALARKIVSDYIVAALRKRNLEYNRLYDAIGERAIPSIRFAAKGDEKYFNVKSIKQRWTKKT
ncbi:MAG: phenylacetate--CoA ligase family protein [Candidatus Spechtbacteria bacterium]|nr:phenylacetate--CoA ligase family protein [Candidatus Spechtbacteria bacterium]